MRPVDKGEAPSSYADWGQARNDLADRIGWYCSYCEMAVTQMIEIEHVVPRSRGGDALSWENFLLSCKYCNTIKGDRNVGRSGFIWPDRDNSDLAFRYSESDVIVPIGSAASSEAAATIDLMGLDRRPGAQDPPTEADSRWIHRLSAWLVARQSFDNWTCSRSELMALQIALTAKGYGFFSVWMTVFQDVPEVLDAIRSQFPGTFSEFEVDGSRNVRKGGII